MKKIIFLLTLIAFLDTSCNKFLDRNPLAQLSSSVFWKTQSDIDQALTSCYGSMQNSIYSYGLPTWDNIADNGYCQHDYNSSSEIVAGNINTSTGGFISSVYGSAFSGIARVNIFLDHLSSFTDINDATKKKYEAEAKMIRAHYYSYLYRCYGAVPIVDKLLNLTTQYMAKSSAADVYNFIISDMDFAIANLPDITYSAAKGHWTMGAAKAYEARMLLYTAYDSNGSAVTATMEKAKALLTSITGYSLAPDYSDNFRDIQQESCPEIMMSVKFLAPNNATAADQWYGDWIVVSPLANLIKEYEFKDGEPGISIPTIGKSLVNINAFNNDSLLKRDPRLAKTIFIDKYIINGVTYTPSNSRPLGTGLSKFLSPNLQPPYGYSTNSQQDWVLIRYADVLLMLAEAENEINGPTQITYDAINKIRRRAAMPDLPTGLTKEQMREKIRHERRIELAFEGQRYFDLKRWKIAKNVLNNVTDGLITYKFEDKHYLWPIPQSEIDVNKGILVQNPDYK